MKIKICILMLFIVFGIFSAFSLGNTDYKSLTDHDRILLGISYYEVALKYKELGKNDLYDSYLNEALRIERNVKKYASGEMEIPEKAININLDELVPDDEINTDDNTGDMTSMNMTGDKKKN
jgi:hypothetical protein